MSDLWVFGYGSLMWRPGFAFEEVAPARLHGAHRALCVYSWVHRGTREHPGLVLGLDRGGACRGLAYRVRARDREQVIDYLRGREMVTSVYLERWRTIENLNSGKSLVALSYLVDRNHDQYAGRLPLEHQLDLIRGAQGQSGANIDYVVNTAELLQELGILDHGLDWLSGRLAVQE
jgi:cation transport protein ChaC